MPTVPDITRGWTMFSSARTPMTMIRMAGTTWSGAVRAATMTGGIQATKGPKKGMAMSAPESTAEAAVYREAEHQLAGEGDEEVDRRRAMPGRAGSPRRSVATLTRRRRNSSM